MSWLAAASVFIVGMIAGVGLMIALMLRSHRAFTEMFTTAPKGK